MSNLSMILLAGALSVAATAPTLAAAQSTPAKPGAARPAAGQQQPRPPQTRANAIKGLDANFKAVDANGDGNLSAAELATAEGKVQQRRIAARRAQHEAGFTKLDTNKDGSLSKAEFMAAAPTAASATPNGAALLSKLDANKDGKVSPDEYRAPVLATFDRADTNKDGVISDAERKAARN